MPPPRRLLRTDCRRIASWFSGKGDWYADAEMDLFEITLGFEMDGRLRRGSDVIFEHASWTKFAELALHEIQNFFVSDIACGGDNQTVGSKPIAETIDQVFAIEAADGF